jgi:MFS family permease
MLIANKRVFVAIFSAYYLTVPDSTVKTVGIILFFGTISGFLFEIPSGYLSDKMGHKKAIVLSRLLIFFSTLTLLVANTTWLMILGSVLLSISHSFLSGTGTAFMHETLRGLNREKEYSKVMGKVSAIGFAVPIPLMVLTPFLVSIDFKTPFLIALMLDFISLMVAITFVKPPVSQEQVDEINTTNFKQVIKEGYGLSYFQYGIFSAIIGGFLFSTSNFRPVYQLALEIPVIYYGVFVGIGRALVSLMLAYSGRIKDRFNIYTFCRFKLILYASFLIILSITANPIVVVVIFIVLNGFQWGLMEVERGFTMEIIKNSNFKATLMSATAQIHQIVTALVSLSLGYVIAQSSYQIGFLYLAVAYIIILLPIYLYMRKANKF